MQCVTSTQHQRDCLAGPPLPKVFPCCRSTSENQRLFDVLPAWYRRVADIVAQVEADEAGRELLLIYVEVQRTKQQHFGQRMLDYYTLLRRSTSLPVLPYAVLLYPGRPALGYRTYEERFRGRTVASLTYFQVSLPSLDARQYAASDNALARALASTMRLPNLEEERQGIYRAAIAAILGALGRDEMDDDAAAALWTLVHTYLPYRIERPDEVDVERTPSSGAASIPSPPP
jgi:hypothetical protein